MLFWLILLAVNLWIVWKCVKMGADKAAKDAFDNAVHRFWHSSPYEDLTRPFFKRVQTLVHWGTKRGY